MQTERDVDVCGGWLRLIHANIVAFGWLCSRVREHVDGLQIEVGWLGSSVVRLAERNEPPVPWALGARLARSSLSLDPSHPTAQQELRPPIAIRYRDRRVVLDRWLICGLSVPMLQ